MMNEQILIGELAKKAGVSVRTIRYYVMEGLLPSPEVRGRYTVYDEEYLNRIILIRYLKDDTETIETFSVKISPATTTLNEFEGGIDGNHLTENISSLAVNQSGDKIFYQTYPGSESSVFACLRRSLIRLFFVSSASATPGPAVASSPKAI